jgi:hypothetical protein
MNLEEIFNKAKWFNCPCEQSHNETIDELRKDILKYIEYKMSTIKICTCHLDSIAGDGD